MSPLPPQPITPPDDFPVSWPHPEDARLSWTLDRMHHGKPLTPMYASVHARYMAGRLRAFQHYGRPIADERWLDINMYHYSAVVPMAGSPEEVAALVESGLRRAEADAAHLAELWEDRYLPEILDHLAYWDGFDLRGATLPGLSAHLDETIERAARLWEIHFLLPIQLARGQLEELYRDLFGSEDTLAVYRLLQGFDNKSLQMGRALWQLSRQALRHAAVRQAFTADDAAGVLPALERLDEAQPFLVDMRAFLEEFGRRFDTWDLGNPSWLEEPTPVIRMIQAYTARDDYEPVAELHSLAAEREQLLAETRERLRAFPQPVVDQFEAVLKSAQAANVLLEDHNFYIDFSAMYCVRRVILEFGRRLANAGALDDARDVFYLKLDELRQTAGAQPFVDRRALAGRRRAEMDHWQRITPPASLGTPRQALPDNLLARSTALFFGTPARGGEPGVLRGHPGSPGTARARARVIHRLAEAGTLRPGDVLVAEATAPPWTPLFAVASAVVTDVGGVLSHCAVVAREYHIPAVVGTGDATTRISDGQLLEVDGNAGIVRLLE